MDHRKLVVAAILLTTCFVAFALTYLLLQDPTSATAAYIGILGIIMIFAEPFAGLVNYLIFLYIRPQEYVEGLMGLRVMLMLGIATFVLMMLQMTVKYRTITLARVPQNIFVLWFFLALGASHLARAYVHGARMSMQDFFSTVVMYFLIANLVTSRRKLKFTVDLVTILTLILAGQGIYQFYTGAGFGGQEMVDGRIQAVGIFSDPNDLALALVIVLPYLFLRFAENKKSRDRILAVLAMGILVYALYLTASRGGMLSFGVLMIILLSRKYGILPGVVVGGLVMIAVFVVVPRMATISADEASAYGRIEAWAIGLDLFEQYPFFGVGAGAYTEYHYITAHNSFVLCASELGMFGTFPWVMLIYLSIKNNGFVARRAPAERMEDMAIYADAVRFGLIAFVLAAYFLSRTYNELLFILIGLSAATTHLFVKDSVNRYALLERKDFIYAFLLVVAGWAVTKAFLYAAW